MANFETSVSLIMECRPLSTAHPACSPLADLTVCPFFSLRGMPIDAPHLKLLLSRTSTLRFHISCRRFIIFSCRHTSIIDVAPSPSLLLPPGPSGGGVCNTRPDDLRKAVLLSSNKSIDFHNYHRDFHLPA